MSNQRLSIDYKKCTIFSNQAKQLGVYEEEQHVPFLGTYGIEKLETNQ
jgi:hypothetical protein